MSRCFKVWLGIPFAVIFADIRWGRSS